jgi:drug/metabolite transporter (DMT)-like permease
VAALGAQRSGAFLHLLPVFAALLAALLLGESFHGYHAAGIALVLLGVRVASGAPRPGRERG